MARAVQPTARSSSAGCRCCRRTTCSCSSSPCVRDGRRSALLFTRTVARPADAGRRVRPRGVAPARRPGRRACVTLGWVLSAAVGVARRAARSCRPSSGLNPHATDLLFVYALHRRRRRRARLPGRRASSAGWSSASLMSLRDRLPRRRPSRPIAVLVLLVGGAAGPRPRGLVRGAREARQRVTADATTRAATRSLAHAPASRRGSPRASLLGAHVRCSTRSATTSSPLSPRTSAPPPG